MPLKGRVKVEQIFEYNICNQADEEIFYKQCAAIEKHIPGLEKYAFLEDVDGTLCQKYTSSAGEIIVKSDMQIDAVYVTADYDLEKFFVKGESVMAGKYTETEIAAMERKIKFPFETVLCPRCGSELVHREVGNSCEVRCQTDDCLIGTVRGL